MTIRTWWLQMAVGSAALVACIWVVPYIPTNDGPQSALASHIQNHYADPGSLFPHQVVPNFAFTHLAFSLLFTPLEALLPWRDALRLTLSIGALGMAWAFAWLVAAVDPRRRPLGLLGFAFALTWSFYMGFFSCEMATALGLAIIAYVIGKEQPSRLQYVLIGCGLFAVALAHVFAATWTGLAILCVLTSRASRGERLREVGRAALLGLPSMAVLAGAWSHQQDLAHVPLSSAFTWVPLSEQALRLPGLVLPGPRARSWIAILLFTTALVGVFVRWRSARPLERVLASLASALLVIAVVAPIDMPGWQLFSPRFLAPVPAIAVALVPLERLGASRARRLALAAVAIAAVASLAVSGALHKRLYRGCADLLSGLDDAVRRSSYVLPIVLDPYCGVDRSPERSEVPYLAPARHLGALYALAQGGSIPYLFVGTSPAHAFRLRTDVDEAAPKGIPSVERYWPAVDSSTFRADATFRRRIVTELAVYGTGYEAILAFGAEPRDVEVFEQMGFVPERAQGSLLVAGFRGCDASLHLHATAGRQALRLEWGLSILAQPVVDRVLPQPPPEASGALVLPLTRVVCGDMWLRLTRATGSRTQQPGSVCEGADPGGRIHAVLAPQTRGVIECQASTAVPE